MEGKHEAALNLARDCLSKHSRLLLRLSLAVQLLIFIYSILYDLISAIVFGTRAMLIEMIIVDLALVLAMIP